MYQALTGTVLSIRCSKVATLNPSSSTSSSSRPPPFSSELAEGSHSYGAIWPISDPISSSELCIESKLSLAEL